MEGLLILLLGLAVGIASADAKGVDHVQHYNMRINEMGTDFKETLDIDPANGVEIFTVPAHNDIEATTYIHHFPSNLQMQVLTVRGECYLEDMSQSSRSGELSEPQDLIQAMEEDDSAESAEEEVLVHTVEDFWRVGDEMAAPERLHLPAVMQKHCRDFPIFYTERMKDTVKITHPDDDAEGELRDVGHSLHDKLEMLNQHRRSARAAHTPRCRAADLRSRCKVERKSCSHYKTRTDIYRTCRLQQHTSGRKVNVCNKITHNIDAVLCCRECCSNAAGADEYFPYCATMNFFQCGTHREDKKKQWKVPVHG